jgi:predicted dehydrogenase
VLADPAIDAVIVATPDDTHEQITVDALKAGKSVLLQKPMGLSTSECRNILAAEANSNARLTVSFMHRYFPEVLWVRDFLKQDKLGAIHSVRLRNATPGADWSDWFFSKDRVGGGVVMQLGVHGIDLCQHLFGSIVGVQAMLFTAKPERLLIDGRRIETSLEDTVFAAYQFESGLRATHEISDTEVAGCDRFRLEIYAELGTVWLRTERGSAALCAPTLTGTNDWIAPDLRGETFGAAHHRHWLAIVRGDDVRDDTPEAGFSSIDVAEHIYKAAMQRRFIRIEHRGI